jgi:hypothetical protein
VGSAGGSDAGGSCVIYSLIYKNLRDGMTTFTGLYVLSYKHHDDFFKINNLFYQHAFVPVVEAAVHHLV